MSASGQGTFTMLFAGGGTGGHLMPGLSVAEELRQRFPESRLVFAGASSALEKRMVERRRFEFRALPCVKFDGSPLSVPGWLARTSGGLWAARRLVAELDPAVIVSLGGHAALAPSLAGVLAGVPLAVMEQNALPGKVSRILSQWAREVYAPWPGTEEHFRNPDRVIVTGNPVRSDLPRPRSAESATRFGLDPHKKTLLVACGSQGAQAVNRAVIAALPRLEAEKSWLQILHSTGEVSYEETRVAYARCPLQSAVLPFIEEMPAAYALSDLALCRAGGTTLAELTVQGVAAVLVPLPAAANDHQRKNASHIAGAGAAFLLDQADLSGERLAAALLNLLRNEETLQRMRAASLLVGRPKATENVVTRLITMLPSQPAPLAAPAAAVQGGG